MSRVCAVCDNPSKDIVFQQRLKLPEGCCTYTGYDIVVCSQCGFLYADTSYSQTASDRHYAGCTKVAQTLEASGEPPEDKVRLDNSLKHIRRCTTSPGSVIDVGCGTGYLLSQLKQDGFDRVAGIDQSPAAAQIARTKYNIDVTVGSILDYKSGSFDLITVCHVLEHIVDLPQFVARLYGLLQRGGTLYVEVPDALQFDRFADPSSGDDWIYIRDLFTHFTPEHVNFFSPTSLRNLMLRLGFIEVFCQSDPLGVIVSAWHRRELERDLDAAEVLRSYAAHSRKLQQGALDVIDRLARSRQEVLVWGAGLHTQRLLAFGGLDAVNIRAFLDSDLSYQGARLAGRSIVQPQDVRQFDKHLPIVVSSWKAQRQIAQAIARMEIDNPIVLLYGNI